MSSQWSGANGKGPETYFYRKRVIVCGVHMCTCGKKFSIVVFREDVLDVWPQILGYQDPEILGSQDSKILGFKDPEIQGPRILRSWDHQIPGFQDPNFQ